MNQQQALQQTFTHARTYFPSLGSSYKGRPVLFFDNSAGAQVSQFVIDRVTDYYIHRNAQKGTIFARTEEMQHTIVDARQLAADLIGANDHSEIAFGQNATNFFHLFAHHLGRDLTKGDHIVITEADHHANVNPWMELAERGIHVHLWNVDDQGNLDFAQYEELLALRPKIVAAGWASNATGTIHDMKKITAMAHAAGALVVADGVQAASHIALDVKEAGVDFSAFSTYKIFGPHMGFGYVNRDHLNRLNGWRIKEELEKDAYFFEVGSQNHEGIEGFIGSMDYLAQVTKDAQANGFSLDETPLAQARPKRRELAGAMHFAHLFEQQLTDHFLAKLADVEHVVLYGKTAEQSAERLPVFSFNIEGIEPDVLGRELNEAGVEARTGNYLAINLMKRLAPSFGGSALRISLVHYNTVEEIDRFFEILDEVLVNLKTRIF
ncbi:aminotransferase class V-fold PLP-dependent enzyme [Sporosarcina aquimarina]|uniref:Aminotransferase class V-fold PLP-dependent enzyme n=1 Tax=Sporosarcina aquimarina TaxID=114975 RepID=A0ABU4FVQ1_9BACL|nr:aminotransferase class V-fold PLP-dependent enzyme [Sporosarcina aquimarina]MDW0108779.1 aminotransferase class V-fold PLP-dependent enzyme [Sporosarcina aquimarina]